MDILVVAFFPGNHSPNTVGGFDWFYDDFDGREAARRAVSLVDIGDSSLTVVRLRVPAGLRRGDYDAITAWVDTVVELYELPEQV